MLAGGHHPSLPGAGMNSGQVRRATPKLRQMLRARCPLGAKLDAHPGFLICRCSRRSSEIAAGFEVTADLEIVGFGLSSDVSFAGFAADFAAFLAI